MSEPPSQRAVDASLAAAIDALLPQTQCTRCGYAGCQPYAAALAAGEADINQCPPGGDTTIQALANLLGRAPKPLNPANGVAGPPLIAVIDEARCIGCARCLPACPVDAIIGAQRFMHTVIDATCTGCELCIPPCPVDCISMQPAIDAHGQPFSATTSLAHLQAAAATHRRRYQAHVARGERLQAERAALLDAKKRLAERWRGVGRTS